MAKRLEDMTVQEARDAGRIDEYNSIVSGYGYGGVSGYTPPSSTGGAGGARGDDFADAYSSVYGDIPASTDSTGTIESLRASGLSDQEIADRLRNSEFELAGGGSYGTQPVGLSPTKAAGLAKQYGLSGFNGIDFTGMSSSEATKKAKEYQEKYKTQTSQLTSYTYNPETMTGVKKATDNFLLGLNKINVEPWTKGGTKQDNINTQLAVTASELAKNWTDTQSFLRDFTTNPEIQNSLQGFLNAGGTKEQVIEGIRNNSMEYAPKDAMQSTDEYLANMNPEDQALRQRAVDELIPELNIAQDEIARNFGIAEDLKDLYFGTPEQVGIYEKRIIEAKEAKRILEERERDAETETRDRANLKIEIEEKQLEQDLAKNEKNRLTAKNYMTGMLAKMGALNTTTASAQAITELDVKYQQQEQKLESDARYRIQSTKIDLAADLNEIENKTDENILKIEQDLSKDAETIAKEIMKAEQTANKEMFNITSKYAALIRTQTAKYKKEAEDAATKYAKDYAYAASGGISLSELSSSIGMNEASEGDYVVAGKQKGVLSPSGEIIPLTLTPTQQQQVQNGRINGIEAMKYFLALPAAFRNEWIQAVANSQDRYEISLVKKAYEEWSKEKEKKTTSSSEREV
jgi:hypothetical protein